jgi:hypothetical protein
MGVRNTRPKNFQNPAKSPEKRCSQTISEVDEMRACDRRQHSQMKNNRSDAHQSRKGQGRQTGAAFISFRRSEIAHSPRRHERAISIETREPLPVEGNVEIVHCAGAPVDPDPASLTAPIRSDGIAASQRAVRVDVGRSVAKPVPDSGHRRAGPRRLVWLSPCVRRNQRGYCKHRATCTNQIGPA